MVMCRDAAEMVTDYLEKSLRPRDWLGLRWHLHRCDMCRNYYAQMRATIALLADAPVPPPTPEVEAAAMAARPPAP